MLKLREDYCGRDLWKSILGTWKMHTHNLQLRKIFTEVIFGNLGNVYPQSTIAETSLWKRFGEVIFENLENAYLQYAIAEEICRNSFKKFEKQTRNCGRKEFPQIVERLLRKVNCRNIVCGNINVERLFAER